jgi:CRISPR-associated protein Csx14
MAQAAIPVDLFNPGQVFACLGFLEAAEALLGDAEAGFDWLDETYVKFRLTAAADGNPVGAVLEFLATAKPRRWGPIGYADPSPKKGKVRIEPDDKNSEESEKDLTLGSEDNSAGLEPSETFPAATADRMSLPVRLVGGNRPLIELTHWTDGSSRGSFKLYSGNRSGERIATAMLLGTRDIPRSNQRIGDIKTKGIAQLWEEQREALIERPFHVLTPMGGSFNFDPRGAWTAIDAGYSPNDQKHQVAASPVVEFLAAWGLEHARPEEFDTRRARYAVWGSALPPMLARAALCGGLTTVPLKRFHFELDMSGKNKVVTFAKLDIRP